jgi:DNA polymerase-3 subunit epsilon
MKSGAQMALIDVRYFCHKGMYQGRGDPRKGRDDFWNIFYHLVQVLGVPEQFIHCISYHGSAIDKRYQDVPQHEDDIDLEDAQEHLEQEIYEKTDATLITSDDYVFGDFVQTYLESERLAHIERFLVAAKKFPHLQLLSDRMVLVILANGDKNYRLYARTDAAQEYGSIPPRLFRALVGDGYIPGIKGFGEKSAATLLAEYSSIPEIMQHLNDLKPGVRKHLEKNLFLLQTNFLATDYRTIGTEGFTVVSKEIPEGTTVSMDDTGQIVFNPPEPTPIPSNVTVVENELMEFTNPERLRYYKRLKHYITELAHRIKIDQAAVFFDTETTGVNTETDRIVQFFGLRINPDLSTQMVEVLINPDIPIPETARAIHGITDQMVSGAPVFAGHASAICDLFHGAVYILAYNLPFDMLLLINEFQRTDMAFDTSGMMYIDVLKLEQLVVTHKLGAAYKRYTGEELMDAHGAGADTLATLTVFTHQLTGENELAEVTEWADLEVLSRGKNAVDLSGKLVRNDDGIICFNFGNDKVKGTPVANNPKYAQWVLGKDFPADTKAIILDELELAQSRENTL